MPADSLMDCRPDPEGPINSCRYLSFIVGGRAGSVTGREPAKTWPYIRPAFLVVSSSGGPRKLLVGVGLSSVKQLNK